MAVAVIDDFHTIGLERLQALGEPLRARDAHGRTLTNGCTSTDSKTPSVT
jgi:hypothetical protein